jgi:hypothetical protein
MIDLHAEAEGRGRRPEKRLVHRHDCAGANAERVEAGTSAVDAFRIVGRSTLRHITANETAAQRLDSEGVHQMRGPSLELLFLLSEVE